MSVEMASGKPQPPRRRIHLGYLDGLRGLAALQVVAFHVYGRVMFTKHDAPAPSWFCHLTNWLGYGHYAVAIFIVLSGYCLMIPVASAIGWQLRGGITGFARRRARRILPPYYVALVFALVLTFIGIHISPEQGKKLMVGLTPGSLISHLLVVHHLHPVWSKTIDPPMWSVGMEWHIYFIFALILLPVVRKWGIAAAVLVAFAIGLLPQYILPASYNFSWTCPWYIGLFALGMLGATLNFASTYVGHTWNNSRLWASCTLALTAIFLGFVTYFGRLVLGGEIFFSPEWLPDTIAGLGAMCFICYATATLHEREASDIPIAVRFLQSRFLVFIGTMSYSLYLIHQPLTEGIYQVLRRFHLARVPSFFLFFLIVLPVVIGLSYLFHIAFERRFMNAALPETDRRMRKLQAPTAGAI